jgi:hypothetical protein
MLLNIFKIYIPKINIAISVAGKRILPLSSLLLVHGMVILELPLLSCFLKEEILRVKALRMTEKVNSCLILSF